MKLKLLRQLLMLSKYVAYGVFLQLFIAHLALAAGTNVQKDKLKDIVLTVDFSNQELVQIFDVLSAETDFNFIYNGATVDVNKKISVKSDRKPLYSILMDISKKADVQFKRVNASIYVKNRIGNETNVIDIIQSERQTRTITGKVTSFEDGSSMPGVNILEKGTNNGTVTDVDGNYTIQVGEGATLVFSSVGYTGEEVAVGNQSVINMQLTPDIQQLQELVVVGYGTQRKSDVTGALTSISAETIEERPVQNLAQALQGKAPGMDITSNIKPGELPDVVIRGNRSLEASNSPLYVLDGIPLTAGNLSDLNPNDIASVEILKDASATAIYGSRGANGVILVTTKRAERGQVTVNYNTTISLDHYNSLTDWMDGGQYVDRWRLSLMNGGLYGNEQFTNPNTPVQLGYPDPDLDLAMFGGVASDPQAARSILMGYEWEDQIGGTVSMRSTTAEEQAMGWPAQVPVYNSDNVRTFDWGDAATRQGVTQNHQLSLSSGTENSRLYLSFAFLDQLGVQRDQDYKRYSGVINGDIAANDWLTLGTSINASLSIQNFGIFPPNTSNTGSKDLYSRATDQFPYALPRNEGGEFVQNPGGNLSLWNPLIDIDQAVNERRAAAIFANMFGEIQFTPWLKYRLNFGSQYRNYRVGQWTGPEATSHLTNSPNTANFDNEERFSWVAENLLYVDKTFNDVHSIGLTLLQSAQQFRLEGVGARVSSMIYDVSRWYDLASNLRGQPDGYGSRFRENTLMSWMGRLNYGFMDKYLLTVSGRYDGASVLAPGHKWDFFPSAAVAWKMQEEPFMNNIDWVDELKIRLGYGVVGNSSVNPYTTTGPLSRNPYVFGAEPAIGFLPQLVPNPLLGWEKTAELNIGLDFAFARGRIAGSLEVYDAKTSDLIMRKALPAVSGFVEKLENVGKTRNRGVELSLSTVNIEAQDFSWSTDISWYSNKEEIVELLNGEEDMLAQRWFIGEPLHVYYQYDNDGIWQNTPEDLEEMAKFNENGHEFYPGTIKVVDQNGDYQITGDDQVIRGTSRPKWTGGLTNTFRYKNWELSSFLYARVGQTYFGGYPNSYGGNWPNGRVENDVWSWDNPGGRWPMPNFGNVENITAAMQYNDGTFFIVRNISLSYNFPQTWLDRIAIQNLQVNLQVLNPFIFGGEVVQWGLNPDDTKNWERASSNTNPLGGMNSNTILPQSYVLGLRVGF